MDRILLTGLAAMLSLDAQLVVDHVTVAGRSLKPMESALSSVGLHAEYGGPHANGATEMALVSFPDGSYLELIALQPNGSAETFHKHEWWKFLDGDAGPCAWATRSADVGVEAERLRKAGIPVSAAIKNGRSRPDGVRLEWETAKVGPGGNGTFFPFLIRDFTSRDLRAFPSGRATTAEYGGIAGVVIGVRDLDAAVRWYRQAYALPEPRRENDAGFGAKLARFAGSPVTLATPLDGGSWLDGRLDQFGDAPCAFILKAKTPTGSKHWLDSGKLGWRLGVE